MPSSLNTCFYILGVPIILAIIINKRDSLTSYIYLIDFTLFHVVVLSHDVLAKFFLDYIALCAYYEKERKKSVLNNINAVKQKYEVGIK